MEALGFPETQRVLLCVKEGPQAPSSAPELSPELKGPMPSAGLWNSSLQTGPAPSAALPRAPSLSCLLPALLLSLCRHC